MNKRIWILFVALAVLTVPAFGQFHQIREIDNEESPGGWSGVSTVSNGNYLDNPCTATQDWVWVDYSAWVEGTQAAAGVDRYLFDESTSMNGMYAAKGGSQTDVAYAEPVELRQYHKVNTSDNFHVVTVINFDPASRSTYVTMETACGNGMPDSPQ